MSITSFNTVHVEELYLKGVPFTVENFRGEAGDVPTIDDTADPGDAGTDWNPLYDFKLIASPGELRGMVFNLPDPLAVDERYPIADTDPIEYEMYNKTMFYVQPESAWGSSTVSVLDHNNVFLGKLYSQSQVMKFVNANGTWRIC